MSNQRQYYAGKSIGIRVTIPETITDPKDRVAYYRREYCRLRRALKRDQYLASLRAYMARNKQRLLANTRAWANRNKAYLAAYRQTEHAKKVHRAWKDRNRERINTWYRQRYSKEKDKQKFLKYRYKRIAEQNQCKSDGTADAFYRFVRSKKTINCYYCGEAISGAKAHIDHVIAVSRRGNHASENLCASCPQCNQRKWRKLPSEINFLRQPLLNL